MKMKIMLAAIVLALCCGLTAFGQQSSPSGEQSPAQKKGLLGKIFGQDSKSKKTPPKTTGETKKTSAPAERLEPDDTNSLPSDVPAETQANRREMISEEEATIAPYYNNFFATYRLGPEDVISVTVFDQPRYSRAGLTIPPSGRISMPLIAGGILVNGKTVEEVAETIRKQYDEYIIDPKVDVSLDRAVSYRYSVIGDVAQPGIKLMSRRLTVREALAEAGGVLNTGDSSKVAILRRMADGRLDTISVNVKKILQGKIPDDKYLAPGDQIIVPGNTFKKIKQVMDLMPIVSFARIFTGGW
ncbi:MAG: polysaccharide biosynthesis/export protein [Blastocatellia bacterium]|jgi:polysaccharide export outer membrane protein|nr:polysaccharide biosynthesis/export protein [Blastocatellia bacterium]